MEMRDKLLEAAARVFAETGYKGATTRRIAQDAGVNEVTLFRHFGSKRELILESLQHFGESVAGVALPLEPEDPERELTHWARGHLRHLSGVSGLIRATMAAAEENELAFCGCEHPRRAGRELREYLQRLRERGLVGDDFDEVAASAMLLGTLFADAMGRDQMPEIFPVDEDAAAAAYVRLFLGAIGVRDPEESGSAVQSS